MEVDDDAMQSSMPSTSGQSQSDASKILEKIAAEENAQKGNTSITTASSASSCSRADSSDDEFDYYDRKKTREFLMKTYREALQAPDSIMEPDIEATIKGYLRFGGQPEVIINSLADNYRGYAQYCELVGEWLSDLEGNREVVRECFEKTLSSLIKKRFAADVVDKNFENCDDVDEWLPQLLQQKTWRDLIYTLIEQNPRSKFLMKAIRIISDAGFQHEITSVHPAAQQLEIYCRMVLSAIDNFFMKQKKGPMTEDYENSFADLTRVVCCSEHTYLFAQTLLHEMIKEQKNEASAACAYLAQMLRREALKRNYQDIHDLHLSIEGDNNDVKQSIYTMLNKKCLNQADIIRLYDSYSSSEPPSVEYIQDTVFIDMLINTLFAYEGNKVQPNHRSKYIFLLCYASCRTSNDANKESEDEEIEQTKEIMEQILDSIRSGRESFRNVSLLLSGIEFPSIAAGLLHYLQEFLLNDKTLEECEVVHFVLLDEIATKQNGLHIRLFKLLRELYDHQSKFLEPAEMIIAKQRNIIDRFVHLLSVGFVLPVVENINKMFQEGQIDVSLVRYFAVEVLDIIEPPYSEEFTETFLPILLHEEIFDKKAMEKAPAVNQFIQDATFKTVEGGSDENIMECETTANTNELILLDTGFV